MPDLDVQARDAHIADVLRVMRALSPDRISSFQEESVRALLRFLLPGPRQGDLFEAAPARDEGRLVEATKAIVREGRPCHDLNTGLAIKVALIVGHVRAGSWERVGAGEAGSVAPILRRPIPEGAQDGSNDGRHADDGPVEFAFPWHPGKLRKADRLGLGTAHVDLQEVASVDAPVACSLWTPDGRLDVRRLESGWLRPLLSPGSWKPMTVADFRAAAREGTAWRDNPFLTRQGGCVPVFHLHDYAEPKPRAKGDEARIVEAGDACLVRAGQLHVIDGIVHRSSSPPLAGFVTTYVDDAPLTAPAWRMGDLGSTQGMDTFGRSSTATWCNGMPMPDRLGTPDPDGCLVPLPDWIGVARRMSSGHAIRPRAIAVKAPSIDDLVWLQDVPGLGPDPTSAFRVSAAMAVRLLPLAHMLDPSAGGHACVRLKEALAGLVTARDVGQYAGRETALMAAVRTCCGEVLDLVGPMTDPRAGMWGYVASLASHAAEHAPYAQDDAWELEDLRL